MRCVQGLLESSQLSEVGCINKQSGPETGGPDHTVDIQLTVFWCAGATDEWELTFFWASLGTVWLPHKHSYMVKIFCQLAVTRWEFLLGYMYHYYRDSHIYWAQSKHHVTLELLSVCLSVYVHLLFIHRSTIHLPSINLVTYIYHLSICHLSTYTSSIHSSTMHLSIHHLSSIIHPPTIYPPICLSIHLSSYHSFPSINHPFIYPPILPSFCPCIYSNTQLSSTYFHLSINHPSIYQPSIHLPIHLFISIHPPIHLFYWWGEIQDIIHNKHSLYGRETPTSMSMSDF